MVTPPALPSRRSTVLVASKARLSLAPRVPEKKYLPSLCTRTHTGSSAVNSTRTAALGWDAEVPAAPPREARELRKAAEFRWEPWTAEPPAMGMAARGPAVALVERPQPRGFDARPLDGGRAATRRTKRTNPSTAASRPPRAPRPRATTTTIGSDFRQPPPTPRRAAREWRNPRVWALRRRREPPGADRACAAIRRRFFLRRDPAGGRTGG